MANALPKIVTPRGTALWPHLSTPDTRFNEAGEYKVTLVVAEAAAQKFIAGLDKLADEAFEDAKSKCKPAKIKTLLKHVPYEMECDEEGNETGNVLIKFKSKASYENKKGETVSMKPTLVDGKGKVITKKLNIGNGSEIVINCSPKGFYLAATNQAGVTLYLNGVQILKLVEYGASAESMGFTAQEDGFDADDVAEATGEAPIEDDDNVPDF